MSSLLRWVGLAAILYFVFCIPVGHDQSISQHVQTLWAEANMGHAVNKQICRIRQNAIARVRRWRNSQTLHADVEAAEDGADLDPSDIHQNHRAPPRQAKHRRGSGTW